MTFIECIGWLGNACFLGRVLIQWLRVERTRDIAAPGVFWLLSLAGSLLLGTYAVERENWVLLVGFAANSLIYLRNLSLGSAVLDAVLPRLVAIPLALAAFVALSLAGVASTGFGAREPTAWILIAVLGQALWTGRFVLQWCYSESIGRSHFPTAFWMVSLLGNLLLLAYASHLRDLVLASGLALGPVVQMRNLVLTWRVDVKQPDAGQRLLLSPRRGAASKGVAAMAAVAVARVRSERRTGEAPPG